MDSDVLLVVVVAVATAVGAGVGGVIAGLVTLRAEDKRQQRERDREEEGRSRDLKEAARLVDEELRESAQLIGAAVFQSRWWTSPSRLPTDAYGRYRSTLAVGVTDDEWTVLSIAHQELNRVNLERDRDEFPESRERQGALGDPFGPLDQPELLSIGIAVVEARKGIAS